MADISSEVEQQLAGLSDGEWSALSAKVRAPDSAEALRTAASKHLSEDQVDNFVRFADPSKFVDADGQIDQAKVSNYMTTVFGAPAAGRVNPHWGQHSQNALGPVPGDAGKVAAAKRFGNDLEPDVAARSALGAGTTRGASARAALAKRFPQKGKQ